jgi:hypothetical protein
VLAVVSNSDIVNALTTATNVASNVANAFANLSLAAPAKNVRKRKAFGDVGNVDMGPRKLRSRK